MTNKEQKQAQLNALYAPYTGCTQCPLGTQGRSRVVFGHGNPDAALLLIGEGPGREEDEQGLPFVGRSGRLLTKALGVMAIAREDIFITNIVKCRPPQNRAPVPEEISMCTSLFLFSQIAIIQPKLICTLGAVATRALLGNNIKISQVRGTLQKKDHLRIVPIYHPAYILRNASEYKTLLQDLAFAINHIDQ